MAAGFSIKEKNIAMLRRNLEEIAQSEISPEDFIPKLKIDAELELDEIGPELIGVIKEFEPFGIGNPEPTFLTKDLEIVDIKRVGKESEHLRPFLKDKLNNTISGIGFGFGGKSLSKGDMVDIVYNLRENVWNSRKTIETRLKDIKKSTKLDNGKLLE